MMRALLERGPDARARRSGGGEAGARRTVRSVLGATRSRGRFAAAVLAVGLGLAGALTGGSVASAHDFLVSTSPAADSTVTDALNEVSLTFNEPPLTELGAGIALQVNDPAGATVSSGEVAILDSTLSIAVAPTTVGTYQVLWQTVSSDGHPVSGEYAFDYQGPVAAPAESPTATPVAPASDSPTVDPSSPPSAAPSASAGAPEPTASAAPAGASSGLPLVFVGVGTAVLLLVVVAVVLVLVLRRRTPRG